jgi:hypothetical protein
MLYKKSPLNWGPLTKSRHSISKHGPLSSFYSMITFFRAPKRPRIVIKKDFFGISLGLYPMSQTPPTNAKGSVAITHTQLANIHR